MKELLDLFLTFAKIGVSTFGGGYAMLPILTREVADNKKWATQEELLDYYAIGQCTPGVIAVNTATFVGRKVKGTAGSVCATLGVVFPSLIIITLIATLISNFREIEWVQHAFGGIRVCVCILIFNSVAKLSKKALIDAPTIIIFAIVCLLSTLTDVSPVVYTLLAAAAGIFMQVKKK